MTTLLSNGLPHSPQRVRMFCVSHRCRCMVYVFVTSIRSATTHPCPNISTLAGEFFVPSVGRFGCSASSTPNCVHENKALVYVTDNVMCWNGWEKDIPPMRRVQRIFLVGNLFECSPHCSLFFVLRINWYSDGSPNRIQRHTHLGHAKISHMHTHTHTFMQIYVRKDKQKWTHDAKD